MPKRVVIHVETEINGDPENFCRAFDDIFRRHTRPEDPWFEINKAILSVTVGSVEEIVDESLEHV